MGLVMFEGRRLRKFWNSGMLGIGQALHRGSSVFISHPHLGSPQHVAGLRGHRQR